MPLLFMLIVGPVVFGAYSWYRHVFERECLALLREENALAAREASVRQPRVLQHSGAPDRRS